MTSFTLKTKMYTLYECSQMRHCGINQNEPTSYELARQHSDLNYPLGQAIWLHVDIFCKIPLGVCKVSDLG